MEEGGGIEFELRLKIKELEKDLLQAQKKIDDYSKELGKKGEEGGKSYADGFGKGVSSYDKTLKKMSDDLGALPGTAGKMGVKLASGLSKPIFAIAPKIAIAMKAMMGPIGIIIGAITAIAGIVMKVVGALKEQAKTTNDAKTASDNLRKSGEQLAQTEGEQIKKWEEKQRKMDKAKNIFKEYNTIALTGKAIALAGKAATDLAGEAQKKFAETFPELNDQIKETVDKTKEKIATELNEIPVVNDVIKKTEELSKEYEKNKGKVIELVKARDEETKAKKRAASETKILKKSTEELLNIQRGYGNQIKLISDQEKLGVKSSADAAKDRLAASEDYLNNLIKTRAETINLVGAESQRVRELDATIAGLQRVIELDRARARNLELSETHTRIAREYELLNKTLSNAVRAGVRTMTQATEQQLSAVQGYTWSLNESIVEMEHNYNQMLEKLTAERGLREATRLTQEMRNNIYAQKAALREYISEEERLVRILESQSNTREEIKKEEKTLQEQIDESRLSALKQYHETLRAAQEDMDKDLITREEYKNREISANQTLYSTLQRQVILYEQMEGYVEGMLDDTESLRDTTVEWLKNNRKAAEEFKKEAIDFKNIAKQVSSGLVNLGEAVLQSQLESIERYVRKRTKILDDQFETDKERIQKEFEFEVELLDKKFQKEKEFLDKEMQEKLYQMGLVDAATVEQYEENLRLAIESGDHHRILAADSALQKYLIEEEYAQKQKELEEQRAKEQKELEERIAAEEKELNERIEKEKIELQFKAEMAAWKMKRLSTYATAAQAIAQAAAMGWPAALAMIPIATGIGAVQIQAVEKAKPVLEYAHGGIVPGNSYTGDNINIGVNSGEMILNKEQQKHLFDLIDGGRADGTTTIVIPVNLDGKPIAKVVVELINNRQYLIKQGSVVK